MNSGISLTIRLQRFLSGSHHLEFPSSRVTMMKRYAGCRANDVLLSHNGGTMMEQQGARAAYSNAQTVVPRLPVFDAWTELHLESDRDEERTTVKIRLDETYSYSSPDCCTAVFTGFRLCRAAWCRVAISQRQVKSAGSRSSPSQSFSLRAHQAARETASVLNFLILIPYRERDGFSPVFPLEWWVSFYRELAFLILVPACIQHGVPATILHGKSRGTEDFSMQNSSPSQRPAAAATALDNE